MKAVILAGGLGTRISEETHLKPKPMVEIGGHPIIWHIMKIYSSYGINDFIICCGYKGYILKEYFANYFLHTSDITFHMDDDNYMEVHQRKSEPWKVTLVDTGELTQTGGRLKRVFRFLNSETFCFTYGDGVSDVNIRDLLEKHKKSEKLATVTTVKPPGRFGALRLDNDLVSNFQEKPDGDNSWINGGFFVLEPEVVELIENDQIIWEEDILPKLVLKNQLGAYKHEGFWHPMDTLRDRNSLDLLCKKGNAPWIKW